MAESIWRVSISTRTRYCERIDLHQRFRPNRSQIVKWIDEKYFDDKDDPIRAELIEVVKLGGAIVVQVGGQ